MATFHLCNSKVKNIQFQPHLDLTPPKSFASHTNLTIPNEPNSIKFNHLRLRFRPQPDNRRSTQIFNHIEKPIMDHPSSTVHDEMPLKVGIIGFGNFGQFIANALKRQGHAVLATSRSDYSDYCKEHGIQYFGDMERMCEEQPDVVLVCSSILSTESVIRKIPMHKLKSDTIFVDVLSVKQFPRNLFLELPESPNFKVELTLNVKQGGGPQSQFYLLDIGSCWKNNGAPCDGDVLTDVTRYSEMIINPQTQAWCSPTNLNACPPYHITPKDKKIYRNDTANFPYGAYHYYCSPGNAMHLEQPVSICDPYSNPQAQELVQIVPHPIWAEYGYPSKQGEGKKCTIIEHLRSLLLATRG